MDWKEAIRRWRALSAEERQRREWAQIPKNVARSMAFEGEPVDLKELEEEHARRPLPELLRKAACGQTESEDDE